LKQSAKQRRAVSAKDFAIPPQGAHRGRYPIPDQAHAMEALAKVEADGTADEKRKVRAAVRKRYPNLPSGQAESSQADQNPDAARATDRIDAAQRLSERSHPPCPAPRGRIPPQTRHRCRDCEYCAHQSSVGPPRAH
jgi:hypothetical protein